MRYNLYLVVGGLVTAGVIIGILTIIPAVSSPWVPSDTYQPGFLTTH